MISTGAMSMALEYIKNAIWDEAAAHGQNVTVCMPMLMSAIKTQWLHQVEMLPGARHCDVQETPLFLDLLGAADCHIRRDAAVADVEHEHGIPLLPLGRMDYR